MPASPDLSHLPPLPDYGPFRALGRNFTLQWPDELDGLLMHPIEPGFQMTSMRLFADAGRYSGRQGFDDQQHHAFISGCRHGLNERRARVLGAQVTNLSGSE